MWEGGLSPRPAIFNKSKAHSLTGTLQLVNRASANNWWGGAGKAWEGEHWAFVWLRLRSHDQVLDWRPQSILMVARRLNVTHCDSQEAWGKGVRTNPAHCRGWPSWQLEATGVIHAAVCHLLCHRVTLASGRSESPFKEHLPFIKQSLIISPNRGRKEQPWRGQKRTGEASGRNGGVISFDLRGDWS